MKAIQVSIDGIPVFISQREPRDYVAIDIGEKGPRFWLERGTDRNTGKSGWKMLAHTDDGDPEVCVFCPDNTDECLVFYEGENWPETER